MRVIRFIPRERNEFAGVLRQRVRAYFSENKISQKDNGTVAVKAIVLLTLYLVPFLGLLFWQNAPVWAWLSLGIVQGVGMAGVGMGIMHDSLHGAFSSSQKVNERWGWTMYLLGGSVFSWKMQHNRAHHTYTNVFGHDEDIRERGYLRFSPNAPWHPIHSFQHIYALVLYPLMTLTMLVKDFASMAEYEREGLLAEEKTTYRKQITHLILVKSAYLIVFIGAPILAGALGLWQSLLYFLLVQCVTGFILAVIFQLAHVVEEATSPMPNPSGNIENEWMIHQLETTINFCPNSALLNWYAGGLNHQVEHHLFPNICHIHYPALSKIVKETADEFGIRYTQINSFWTIMGSHIRFLKRLGQKPVEEPVLEMAA